MPKHSLSRTLNSIHYVVFCMMHEINSEEHNVHQLAKFWSYFEVAGDIDNDTSLTSRQLSRLWPQFSDLMLRCGKREGDTKSDLKELNSVLLDMAGDRIEWSVALTMAPGGKLSIRKA